VCVGVCVCVCVCVSVLGSQLVDFGYVKIVSPLSAVIDGELADIGANLIDDGNGGKITQEWIFPYFEDTLEYDPVVGEDLVSSVCDCV